MLAERRKTTQIIGQPVPAYQSLWKGHVFHNALIQTVSMRRSLQPDALSSLNGCTCMTHLVAAPNLVGVFTHSGRCKKQRRSTSSISTFTSGPVHLGGDKSRMPKQLYVTSMLSVLLVQHILPSTDERTGLILRMEHPLQAGGSGIVGPVMITIHQVIRHSRFRKWNRPMNSHLPLVWSFETDVVQL